MNLKTYCKQIIPARSTVPLTLLKKRLGLGSFYRRTYSESGEDILLCSYLFPHQKNGFYVDIGCFHPKYLSNTYLLHRRGWRGINVDPEAAAIVAYQRSRPKDTNLQIGIDAQSHTQSFYALEHSAASTFDKTTVIQKQNRSRLISETQVDCITLQELFATHLPTGQTIDLLDIDVEHLDFQVLTGNDWDCYRPKVIMIEDRDYRTAGTASRIYQYMHNQGYVFYAYAHITLIMCEKSYAASVKKF